MWINMLDCNAFWSLKIHFDGNCKLIRWRLDLHCCVDGFSQTIIYLLKRLNSELYEDINIFNFLDSLNELHYRLYIMFIWQGTWLRQANLEILKPWQVNAQFQAAIHSKEKYGHAFLFFQARLRQKRNTKNSYSIMCSYSVRPGSVT